MKSMKKRICMAMVASMSVMMAASCGNTSHPVSETTKNALEASEAAGRDSKETAAAGGEMNKPDSIHWMVHTGMNEENGTALWVEEFERLTGIKLKLEIVSNNEYNTILELAFASGTVPEVFDLNGEQKLAVYAKQNAIKDITDMVEGSSLYGEVNKELWDSIRIDGGIYGVPMEVASGAVTYIRKDWLDRLGKEVPKTYEEFLDMLRAFKNNIPECTVPLTAPGLYSVQNLPEFYQGANTDFTKVNGLWVDGFAQDNMKEALERLRAAYAEGLIDVEVVTNTTSACRDQWYSGCVGAFNYWGGNWGQTLTERLQVNYPDAEVLGMNPVDGAEYYYSVPSVLSISNKTAGEKASAIYKYFIEYMHDGGEGQILFQSGVENLHWKQEGNNLIPLPSLSNPEETFRKAWITPWMAIAPLKVTDKNLELHPAVTESLAVLEEYGIQKPAFPVSETLVKISSDLKLIREEILARVVMGDMTVEEGVEKYKNEAVMLNVNKVLQEMNGK